MSYCCSCQKQKILDTVNKLLLLIHENDDLLKSYMLDFFVNNHWSSLPEKWRNALEKLSPEELGQWILYPEPVIYTEVWPLSLISLRSVVRHLSIERQPNSQNWISPSGFSVNCPHTNFLGNADTGKNLESKLYSKHIKPKKFHEIEIMAQITNSSATRAGCKFIVDIGSGLGHLGRILALHYDLKVCCLEEQGCLTEKARKIDEQLAQSLRKIKKDPKGPIHINKSIKAVLKQEELLQTIREAFCIKDGDPFKFGLVGLHPCGDLGPTLMKLLVNCPEACFINLVGCCYMKLSDENSGSAEFLGYPLSEFVYKNPSRNLSYEAKEVCCHALEMYCERLKMGCVEDLKVHCYRSTAECIIVKNWPHLKHSGLKSIKNVHNMPFYKYANEAVEKLGITLPACELDTAEVHIQLDQWMRVVIYYSLRLLVAPLVESVILLDRLLYLEEEGLSTVLIPAFDPKFSPRNHILIAFKDAK